MTLAYIDSVGLVSEGMIGFNATRNVLMGGKYIKSPLEKYKPQVLPPNERRRATGLVRLSFQACEDALDNSSFSPSSLATVFSSSGGDYFVLDSLCNSIAREERLLSPTLFHNSVHNAAAGYWMIGANSHHNSISLAAFDYSFGVGLLEAITLLSLDKQPVLLAIYDAKPPPLIAEKRPISTPFASALILSSKKTPNSQMTLKVKIVEDGTTTEPAHHDLIALFKDNPAARILPLLEHIASGTEGEIITQLPQDKFLKIEMALC